MSDNSDSHELLAVVSSVHHKSIGETFDNWALCLSESLGRIFTSRVWHVDWGSDLNVIAVVQEKKLCQSFNP